MGDSNFNERYHLSFAAAFARGRFPDLASLDDDQAFCGAVARGLKVHKFKRTAGLRRVRRVLAMLSGLGPRSLLDVGAGRGAFLWPLLEAFADLQVTAIDCNEQRASDLGAVARGGIWNLSAVRMDASALAFGDHSFEGVTMLEVLEHMPHPELAAREAVRVARRFVIASAPSHADDNPEHIHLFSPTEVSALFLDAGARTVRVEHVLNHRIALALLGDA